MPAGWTAGADDWQETASAYLAFHELGRPTWIRPGRPWFDLTATHLLTIARVRDDAARLVVMTRVAGVSVEELANAHQVDPQTLRQRRLRTERRVRQSLALTR